MREKRTFKKLGFTLVEIVVAIAMLAMVSLGTGAIVINSQNVSSNNQNQATTQSKASELSDNLYNLLLSTNIGMNYRVSNDSSYGIYSTNDTSEAGEIKTLATILCDTETGLITKRYIKFDRRSHTVYYAEQNVPMNHSSMTIDLDDVAEMTRLDSSGKWQVLATDVKDFSISLKTFKSKGIAEIAFTLDDGQADYTMSKTVTSRNKLSINESTFDIPSYFNAAIEIPHLNESVVVFNYDGSVHNVTVGGLNEKYVTQMGPVTAINAGEYTITWQLKDIGGVTWTDGTTDPKTVTWKITAAKIDKPSASDTALTYTSTSIGPIVSVDEDYVVKTGTDKAVTVGSYSFTMSLKDKMNYQWSDGTKDDVVIDWTIEKRPITIPVVSGTSKELVYNSGSQTPVIANYDTKYVTATGDLSGTTVGMYTITFDLKDKVNTEWSDNTSSLKTDTWVITAASMDIVFAGYSNVYDAAPHTGSIYVAPTYVGYAIKYGLTDGTYDLTAAPTFKDAGKYTVYFKISAPNFADYTNSFDVEIKQKEITITGSDAEKRYDGTALTLNESKLTEGDIVSGQTATYSATGSITNVGIVDNVPDVVIKSRTEDVTANYKITKVNGKLTVKNGLLVHSKVDYTGVYDGDDHTGSVSVTTPETGYTITYGVAAGEHILDSAPLFNDAGKYTVYYKVSAPNYEDATGSFTVNIDQRPIVITADSASKPYDGTPLVANNAVLTSGTLVPSHTALYSASGSIIDAGEIPNVPQILIKDSTGKDVTYNYFITKRNGTLTVINATIIGCSIDYIGTYDGEPHTGSVHVTLPESGYTIKYGVVNNHFDADEIPEFTDPGYYTIYYQISAPNYTTKVSALTVTILNRDITITGGSTSKYYDGTPLTYDMATLTSGELIDGHTAEFHATGSITNAGVISNIPSVIIRDAGGRDVTGFYSITKINGKLTVNRLKIRVPNLTDTSFVYTGATFSTTVHNLNEAYVSQSGKTSASDAGIYTVSWNLKDPDNTEWEDGSSTTKELQWEIERMPITIPSLPRISFYYDNGNTITPVINNANATCIVTTGTTSAIEIGDYTIKWSLKDKKNTKWSDDSLTDKTQNWKIIESMTMVYTTQNYTGIYDGVSHTGSVTVSEPASGYTIKYGTTDGIYTITNLPKYTNAGTYRIYYKITAPEYKPVTGYFSITIARRPITITGGSKEKDYDGEVLTFSNATLTSGTLAEGHTATLTADGSITFVGAVPNIPKIVVKDENGTNVTANYDVTKVNGVLRVKDATIDSHSVNYNAVYDGKPHSGSVIVEVPAAGYTITYGINEGQYDQAVAPSYTDAGTYTVYYEITADNYITKTDFYTVTISKKLINIIAGNKEKVYDGTPLVFNNASILSGSLATGHTATLTADGTITDVGSVPNIPNIVIKDSASRDVTSNYNVVKTNGKLTITSATIIVKSNNYVGTYDGLEHTGSVTVTAPTTGATVKFGIVAGTYDLDTAPKYVNQGTYTVYYKVTAQNYLDSEGTFTVTIARRPITITGGSDTKVYDGTPLVYSSATITSGTLAAGDTAAVLAEGSITNVGTTSNVPTVTVKNAKGIDVTFNYDVTKVNGILTVTKATILCNVSDYNEDYDGKPHSGIVKVTYPASGATVSFGTTNGTYNLVSTPLYTTVGTYTVYYKITAPNFNDKTGSFNVIINKRPITITGESKTRGYDGTELSLNIATITSGTIADDQTYTLTASGSITDVGSVDNIPSIVIKSGTEDVTSNYDITKVNGTLTITAAGIIYEGHDYHDIYDGAAHTGSVDVSLPVSGAVVKYGTSVGTYNLDTAPKYTNVGTYVVYYQISTTNYITAKGSFSVTIDKKELTITADSAEKVYDGTTLTKNSGTITAGSVVSGQTYTITATGTITNVGTQSNVPSIVIKSGSTDVTANYEVTKVNGTLKVTDATITHTSSGTTVDYDGNSHTGTVTVTKPSGGVASVKYWNGSSYSLSSAPTYTNAGTYTVYYQITAPNYKSVTGNYVVTINKVDAWITNPGTQNVGCGTTSMSYLNISYGGGTLTWAKWDIDGNGNWINGDGWYSSISVSGVSTSKIIGLYITGDANHNDVLTCFTVNLGGHTAVYGGTAGIHTKCSHCGATLSSSHTMNVNTGVVYQSQSCTNAQYNYAKCACGYDPRSSSYTVYIAGALGHKWDADSGVHYITASCDKAGYNYLKCSRCGSDPRNSGLVWKYSDALGHNMNTDSGARYANATCTTPYYNYLKCGRCGWDPRSSSYIFSWGSALGHSGAPESVQGDGITAAVYCQRSGCHALIASERAFVTIVLRARTATRCLTESGSSTGRTYGSGNLRRFYQNAGAFCNHLACDGICGTQIHKTENLGHWGPASDWQQPNGIAGMGPTYFNGYWTCPRCLFNAGGFN